jgi:F0F1-type ATP synthase assembly protein I
VALFFMRNNKKEPVNNLIKYSGLGIQMLVSIGVGAWLGLKLDQYLGLKFPLFLITFVFVIFGGLMYQLYRSLNKD